MLGDPIDPTPFLEAMPARVRAAIEQGRARSGPVAAWLVAKGRGWGQVGTTMTLLRDDQVPAEISGWLAGIAMFGDDTDRLVDELEGHAGVAFALEAFAAGVAAALAPAPGQWTRIERLTAIGRPPAALAAVIPFGIASDDRTIRAAAQRLATKLGRVADAVLESAHASAKGTTRRRLSAARAPRDPNAGLMLRMLEAWRATRSRELESAIESLGLVLGRARTAIAARSRAEIESAWAAVAKQCDPIDVARLLATPWPKSLDSARKRVDLFAKFPNDPRIVLGVAGSAKRHRSEQSLRFHRAVAELILDAPTGSVVTAIDAIVGVHDDPEIVETYREAREVAASVETGEADRALLDDAHAASTPQRDLEALWATHVKNPGDLAHRVVLGDALQIAGDPRGELIALQLGTPDAAARKRITQLIAAHGDVWTGPIPNVSKSSRRFERGFIVAMRCTAIGPELRAVIERPEWVTVEELFLDGAGSGLAPLVRRMPLLRRLATPHGDLLAQLARSGKYPTIEALASASAWLPPHNAFPNLRVIGGRWGASAFANAQRDAAALGVHAIVHFGLPEDQLATAIRERTAGPPETRVAMVGDYAGFDSDGWRVRLFRDSRTAELAWGGGPSTLKQGKAEILDVLRRAIADVREVPRIDLGQVS